MIKVYALIFLLSVSNLLFADNKECVIAIKNTENYLPEIGDTEYRDLSLGALQICARQGNEDFVLLAKQMQSACEQSSNKRADRVGLCYLSAAKVIGLSL